MIVIGIMGSKGKSKVIDIIKENLEKNNKEVVMIGTHEDSQDAFEKLLFNEVDYVLISISREDLFENRLKGIIFDIIINLGYHDESHTLKDRINNLLTNIKDMGYYLFNFENYNSFDGTNEIYSISFGLNDKATVTATSIDDLTCLCFSFCLQRAIVTIEKEIIQPFEKPYEVEGKYHDINYYLAALSCLLIIGINKE